MSAAPSRRSASSTTIRAIRSRPCGSRPGGKTRSKAMTRWKMRYSDLTRAMAGYHYGWKFFCGICVGRNLVSSIYRYNYIYIPVYLVYIYIYSCISIHEKIYIYIYIHVYLYIYIFMYVYLHNMRTVNLQT